MRSGLGSSRIMFVIKIDCFKKRLKRESWQFLTPGTKNYPSIHLHKLTELKELKIRLKEYLNDNKENAQFLY